MILRRLFFCVFLIFLSALVSHSLAGERIIYVSEENSFDDDKVNGQTYGSEIVKMVYESIGYKVLSKPCRWKRCLSDVLSGKIDIIFPIFNNEIDRDKPLIIPSQAISSLAVFIIFKRDKWEWKGAETITNKKVVQLRGLDFDKGLTVPVKLQEVTTVAQAERMLISDRADFFLTTSLAIDPAIHQSSISEEDFRVGVAYRYNAYLGFSNTARGKKLIEEFEDQFIKLSAAGAIKSLQKKWNMPPPQ